MTDASNISMKRLKSHPRRRQVHWWYMEIQDARVICIQSRRKWTCAKKKKSICTEKLRRLECKYRLDKKVLTKAILKAKEDSWKALIDTIEENPWGIPYKLVMGRLRASIPGLTETLSSSDFDRIMLELFPKVIDDRENYDAKIDKWDNNWNVTVDEVYRAIGKSQ